jgi:trehalose utilization protein
MTIRALVWNENVHERKNPLVAENYPLGIHGQVAALLSADGSITASTATLQEAEHGLTESRLETTDVLLWWGHAAHAEVRDEIVERVARAVWQGMGIIVLHSGHFSKIFKRLLGAPCALHWREAGERERLWVVNPGHPIARSLPRYFELENEEMYGEPFSVPEPLETMFVSWFQGGEVFRSGITTSAAPAGSFTSGRDTKPTRPITTRPSGKCCATRFTGPTTRSGIRSSSPRRTRRSTSRSKKPSSAARA